jgi:K(+)-stimulated pyrophosphate-energized sodium pump
VFDLIPYLAVVAALAGLLLAAYFAKVVNAADPGTDLMQEIALAIREGAMAFLRREYRAIAIFVAVLTVVIFVVLPFGRPWGAIAYVMGAGFSAVAGFVGMRIATAANVRTANAARHGAGEALPLAYRGGAVMGFTVAGLGLLGISLAYLLFVQVLRVEDAFQVVATFGLGGSSIALFARIGGGIYTKAADVGADLVGKVEAGIPEDDPRNPATIADNVGDNVGDVAGMGADLFESYAGSIVAPMVLAALLFGGLGTDLRPAETLESLQQTTFLFPCSSPPSAWPSRSPVRSSSAGGRDASSPRSCTSGPTSRWPSRPSRRSPPRCGCSATWRRSPRRSGSGCRSCSASRPGT